jgi:hypothetical protein
MHRDELHAHIAATRAEQAAYEAQTKFEDLNLNLGPLTAALLSQAQWRSQFPLFPVWQFFADELEEVLSFADQQGQLARYWPDLTAKRKPQMEAALDELRIARHLYQKQFNVVHWKPVGLADNEGEFLIQGVSKTTIFVEVKGPRWEGELDEEEIESGRTALPKELYCDGRSVAPWERIQFAVKKAYKKFLPAMPNLLVVAGHHLFVSLEYGTDMMAESALFDGSYSGCFTDHTYQNLGGVGIFWLEHNNQACQYRMKLFINTYALTPLPGEFQQFCS